jgi:thymidylate synthase (FAD)
VKAPIFVARQLVKHKFLPWNEVSRRYVDDEPEFYIPDMWRMRAENVKQGSSDYAVDIFPIVADYATPHEMAEDALKYYQMLLGEGICLVRYVRGMARHVEIAIG